MEKILWAGSSDNISKISGSDTFDQIPKGVWELKLSMAGPYLQKVSDDFHFGHKIYGVEEDFINYCTKSLDVAEKNMGILLNGLKGCGKTVTAKILANRSGLPVIIVNSINIDALNYFNNVTQSLCFMFDEFEKIIDHKDMSRVAQLLSFVDGTITVAKHLMIFTSNDTNISEFFIDRPGRIRYIKNYGSLKLEVVKEILNDKLQHPEFKQDILDWVKFFKFLTIDMLISIINEVNIHGVSPTVFKKFFNVDNDKNDYDLTIVMTDPKTGKSITFMHNTLVTYDPAEHFENMTEGDDYAKILGYTAVADIATGTVTEPADSFAQPIYIASVTAIENDDENEFETKDRFLATCKVNPKSHRNLALFYMENPHEKPEEYNSTKQDIVFNTDKTDYIICGKEYNVEFKYTPRSLYKNFNTFAF